MTTFTDTTIVTNTTEREGTKLVVTDNSTTQNIGEVVTDVSISPYIASREIGFAAWNLRPNHVHYIFFDGINVAAHCAPGLINASANNVNRAGNWGDPIKTDSSGLVQGVFRVPDGTFKTGDRILEIADVPDLILGSDAIVSKAVGTFTSSNINVTKKMVTLTTINPIVKVENVTERSVTSNTSVKVTNEPDQTIYNIVYGWYEPIAQGLTINTPNGQAGIYATKLDLYFKQKSLIVGHGVTVYLCEIDNGYPNGNAILPYSTVHLDNASINTSIDATLATTFTFEAPVFLSANKEYAFIVRPDSNDPDYWVYSANIGDVDVTTGGQVSSVPIVGTAFYGATMTQWTALQTEYIKFVLHRANFSTSDGYAYLNNTDAEYIQLQNITYSTTSASVKPGHYVFNSANEVSNSLGGSVNTQIYSIVDYFAPTPLGLYCGNSTGNFPTANAFIQIHDLKRYANGDVQLQPNNTTLVAYGNTYTLVNPQLNAVVPQFATISPAGTKLSYGFKGTSNTYTVDSTYVDIEPGAEKELLDYERLVVSRSKENASMSGAKSVTYRVKMTTDTAFLSPVVDTTRDAHLALANDINPIVSVYEEFFGSSPTRSKYVSKVVTLASGQDAQDLQITLSAYKPPNTQIQVWVKFLNAEDSESMAQKTWTPMRDLASGIFSDPLDPNDIKEFTYTAPFSYPMIPTNGTVTANSVLGTTVNGVTTTFGTDISVGMYVNMLANSTWNEASRRVVSVANSTQLTLNAPFTNNYSSNSIYIVPPPTTAYKSVNTAVVLSGNVTTNTLNNIITGDSSANFTGELVPGSIIRINSDSQQVVAITNSTSLTVGTPWSTYAVANTAYVVNPAGITYYNTVNNLFTTFNQFQIKIVLMSNDSSKVPIIDDLRALALQL